MSIRAVPRALPVLAAFVAIVVAAGTSNAAAKAPKAWTERFDVSDCQWTTTGRNGFFILEPGYRQVFEGREGHAAVRLEITVLDETRSVAGVETRVVEEKESSNGRTTEVSRNFFALCGPGNDAFYFGEEVDIYEDGKVAGHEGGWLADTAGAKPGLFMPARPLLGARFYQEIAPETAMDRVEIVSDSESLESPAGPFERCVKMEETTPLEPGVREYKLFAPGVGLVQDEDLVLVKVERVDVRTR